MITLADRAKAIGERAAERSRSTKAENSARYPEFAAWFASLCAMDPDCRLVAVDYLDTGKCWRAK